MKKLAAALTLLSLTSCSHAPKPAAPSQQNFEAELNTLAVQSQKLKPACEDWYEKMTSLKMGKDFEKEIRIPSKKALAHVLDLLASMPAVDPSGSQGNTLLLDKRPATFKTNEQFKIVGLLLSNCRPTSYFEGMKNVLIHARKTKLTKTEKERIRLLALSHMKRDTENLLPLLNYMIDIETLKDLTKTGLIIPKGDFYSRLLALDEDGKKAKSDFAAAIKTSNGQNWVEDRVMELGHSRDLAKKLSAVLTDL